MLVWITDAAFMTCFRLSTTLWQSRASLIRAHLRWTILRNVTLAPRILYELNSTDLLIRDGHFIASRETLALRSQSRGSRTCLPRPAYLNTDAAQFTLAAYRCIAEDKGQATYRKTCYTRPFRAFPLRSLISDHLLRCRCRHDTPVIFIDDTLKDISAHKGCFKIGMLCAVARGHRLCPDF